jgi:hypothetical protein
LVRGTPGFVALWDFVKRSGGKFAAHQAKGDNRDFSLDAVNYVREYWGEGREASYNDFPTLGRGPFGDAVEFREEPDVTFRPCLLIPRERLHDSELDVKGPGRSVSMLVWLVRRSGNHAIAGIWHEGTDLLLNGRPVPRSERGKRQYALFAGLAANTGASAAHVSENGGRSFGDRYARNLAVTPELIPAVSRDAVDEGWTVVGFTFDNAQNAVTAYINGIATENWIDEPQKHPFFKWPAAGWLQVQLRNDPAYPTDQYYGPPERRARKRKVVETSGDRRVEVEEYAFTKVRVTREKGRVVGRELVSLKVNPYWFAHDLYSPVRPEDGGPFTIGRVIHTSRSVGFTGYIGGAAVFSRALSPSQMRRLSGIGRRQVNGRMIADLLRAASIAQ